MGNSHKPETWSTSAGRRPEWTHNHERTGGIVNPPVWRASTILYPTIADMDAANTKQDDTLFYGRKGTPTTWALREALTGLEPGAAGTMLYPSGVAAIVGAILSVARPGDHILLPDSAYDPTTAFSTGVLKRLGVEAEPYDPLIGAGIAALFRPNTSLLLLESPGSLTFEVQDIPAMTAAARAASIPTLLDNSWAASHFFKGIAAGCDMVMQAITKYVGGHSDLMMGSVSATAPFFARLRSTAWQLGQCVSGDEAALALRGFRTLPLRMARHQQSAMEIASWLKAHPLVDRVLHPAFPDCPGHEIWKRDFSGASGLFGVVLNVGSRADAGLFCDDLQHFGIGFSWGGYESLCIPTSPEKLRKLPGYKPAGLSLRFSIGLEDPADLLDDLSSALKRMEQLHDRPLDE
ncbi:cystathionine beta-lyase [Sandaracinobacteroides hominis]|uniref:cystathionine beta-lyase n=1 Tax=Sandaracinobacteroides hominis TaxID=2780086 RepID=UPI002E2C3093|nr:cystathionine beta-lyase [Sandaracinobacteroides hominis]